MKINIIRPSHVLVFAAEEFKKYLRMMMPNNEDIEICFDSNIEDGFRLGLLEDFGLPCESEDPVLDDIVHIDTTEKGGILAGSNPRSVLFAVYRFLRLNGCRFLYPGVDGEHIPVRDIVPTIYHKKADHRFRGHCNEGAESQTCMLETIDYYAKQELNVYMMEFNIPFYYYNSYYDHENNEKNRVPEPVSKEQVLQWKRQCEAEIAKRGLQFHDMGHGWTAEPYGLSSADGWIEGNFDITDKQKSFLALIDGKRELFQGVALNTNLCMSNPEVRSIMAKAVVEYSKKHANVDYLHVWLADGLRNHCECEECQKARPSDFYLMIMNEIDERLEEAGLSTRIVFIAYFDTMFPPEQITIKTEAVLYGIIALFISTYSIDWLMKTLNISKLAFVITDKGVDISGYLILTSPRGVTLVNGIGAYTQKDRQILICALKDSEIPEFQRKILSLDENAFIIYSESQQIVGKGFYIYG